MHGFLLPPVHLRSTPCEFTPVRGPALAPSSRDIRIPMVTSRDFLFGKLGWTVHVARGWGRQWRAGGIPSGLVGGSLPSGLVGGRVPVPTDILSAKSVVQGCRAEAVHAQVAGSTLRKGNFEDVQFKIQKFKLM